MPTGNDVGSPNLASQLEALSEFYLGAYYVLHKQALAIVKSPDAADEVVQDAFVDATTRIKQGTEIRNLGAWFRTVIHHFCINHKEKRGFQTEPLREDITRATTDSPADIAQRWRCLDEVYRALVDLPTSQKSAFLLAEVHGLNYSDIAHSLGRTENSVRQLLARARSAVRDAVGADMLPLATPVLQLQVQGRLQANGRLQNLSDRFANRLQGVQSTFGALMERPGEFVSHVFQPAAAAIAGVSLVSAVGGLGLENELFLHDKSSPQPAAAVRSLSPKPTPPRAVRKSSSRASRGISVVQIKPGSSPGVARGVSPSLGKESKNGGKPNRPRKRGKGPSSNSGDQAGLSSGPENNDTASSPSGGNDGFSIEDEDVKEIPPVPPEPESPGSRSVPPVGILGEDNNPLLAGGPGALPAAPTATAPEGSTMTPKVIAVVPVGTAGASE